jgi:AcrR family transcriptional regulator
VPRQARAKETVESLLQATEQVLSRDGYDRASTNRIAARAGVNIASLYQYFPNKEALVAALIDRQLERLMALLLPIFDEVASMPLEKAVVRIVTRFLASHIPDVALHEVLLRQVPRIEHLNPVVEWRQRFIEQVRTQLVARKLGAKDLSVAAFMVVHTVEALTQAAVLERPELLSDARYARRVSDLVVRLLQR